MPSFSALLSLSVRDVFGDDGPLPGPVLLNQSQEDLVFFVGPVFLLAFGVVTHQGFERGSFERLIFGHLNSNYLAERGLFGTWIF